MNRSQHQMNLIPLVAKEEWKLAKEHMVRLQGAHGDDIVRTFIADEKVRIRSHRFDLVIESEISPPSSSLAVRMAIFGLFVREWMRQRQRLSHRLLQSLKSRKRARVRKSATSRISNPYPFGTSIIKDGHTRNVGSTYHVTDFRWPLGIVLGIEHSDGTLNIYSLKRFEARRCCGSSENCSINPVGYLFQCNPTKLEV